ncbi:MAG TPA: insulinase family protein, partial [Ruminococcaceae bacterium]|nr:insulinase family protein [Oscillospiraceae bacterium]
MEEVQKRSVCSGINFRSIRDSRFKTARISINFLLPLKKETAAKNALLPFLLTRS